MHRGDIAKITDSYIKIPKHFLHPLNLENSSRLTGLYYPTPKKYITENNSIDEVSHDFIFTPIPFDLWPFLARITIRLKDDIESLAVISSKLAELGVNILLSDFHKAGHRYSTWSLVVEFHEIRNKYHKEKFFLRKNCFENNLYQDYHDHKSKYGRLEGLINYVILDEYFNTKDEKKNLAEIIKKDCGEYLFDFGDKSRLDNKEPVYIKKAKTLPYHFWELKKYQAELKKKRIFKSQNDSISENEEERFEFDCTIDDNKIFFSNGIPKTIKNKIGLNGDRDSTLGFVNIHLNASRIRVSIIPKSQLQRFRKIYVHYVLIGKFKSCKGIIAKITEILIKNNLTIKNTSNKTTTYKKNIEEGVVEFIIKNNKENDVSNKSIIKLIENIDYDNNAFEIRVVNVSPLTYYYVFISIPSSSTSRKKYLSMLSEIGKEYGFDDETLILVAENINPTTDTIVKQIRKSDGMIQFFIPHAGKKDYTWLEAEHLAAKTKGIPVVRITEESQIAKSVISKDTYSVVLNENDQQIKSKLRVVFQKLIKAMRDEMPTHYE